MNFAKLLRTAILKNICEQLFWLQAGESRRNWTAKTYYFYLILLTLTSLKLIFFPTFIYDFFIHIWFVFETKLANGKLYGKLRSVLKHNLKEQDWTVNMVMWKLQIKIFYILGHTDNDKDRLQHAEQQIWLSLTQFQRDLFR